MEIHFSCEEDRPKTYTRYNIIPPVICMSHFSSFFFAHPIKYLHTIYFACSLPSCNPDPGLLSRLFSPLPTAARAFIFIAKRRQPLLPSSTRIEHLLLLCNRLASAYLAGAFSDADAGPGPLAKFRRTVFVLLVTFAYIYISAGHVKPWSQVPSLPPPWYILYVHSYLSRRGFSIATARRLPSNFAKITRLRFS